MSKTQLADVNSTVSLEQENRQLHAALAYRKEQLLQSLAEVVKATKEQFGSRVVIDVEVDPEHPESLHPVLVVVNDGETSLQDRLRWRNTVQDIGGGAFDGIRLAFDHDESE